MNRAILCLMLVVASTGLSAASHTEKLMAELYANYPHKNSPEASVYRGGIVFSHYCALCHGVKADGNGRTAKMYDPRPANLTTSDKNDDYKELIVRQGGAALGRSQFMPPWGGELTDEQIRDVIAFLRSIQQKNP
ncbi:c-type cytochrome [Noviherbaspirillum sp.]|uniref:c-type cytochrome n=1 Tax=Noviherbaspirillum sp. TaxID=1926288 RepID=UPI002FE2F2DD